MKSLLYRLVSDTHLDRLILDLDRGRLRVLTYHGVYDDLWGEPSWLPPFFVPRSVLEVQLDYLKEVACVLPLGEAVERLEKGTLPRRAVAITFDDGYANNLHLALPLLESRDLAATIFVSTGLVESGEIFPSDRMRLLTAFDEEIPEGGFAALYAELPIDVALSRTDAAWRRVEARLPGGVREVLRPLSIEELGRFPPDLVELGAHGHSHCILRNEAAARREIEISRSVAMLGQWTGRPPRLFSYPNGEPGDFGEADKAMLRFHGIRAAFTTTAAANGEGADFLALSRYPVTRHHDRPTFAAEVSGLRATLNALVGKR